METSAPDIIKAVFGGKPRKVRHLLEDQETIREETIKVRFLPANTYPTLVGILADEPRQVELFVGKIEGWANDLHPEDHDAIMREGHEINLPFFEPWVSRRTATQKVIDPGISDRMENAAREIMREILGAKLAEVGLSPSVASAPPSPLPPADPSKASAN